VCEARDGRHALQLLRRHQTRVDLVLTDFIMPLMDGGELAERVRDLNPRMPILLMSATLSGEAAELLGGYSDLPFLRKPFTYLELYRAVAPLLKGRIATPWRQTSGSWRQRSGRDGVSP
jgi:two-component system, cell cycle sensor histidine kinase and response regulator CckA